MGWEWCSAEACQPRKLAAILAEIHPGVSIRGGKFFPWTAGVRQKRTGQTGSGVEAEHEVGAVLLEWELKCFVIGVCANAVLLWHHF